MAEETPNIGFIGAIDQQAELVKYYALPIASFYKALLVNGVPAEGALEIVRDMNWLNWCNIIWPGKPPMGRM